MISTMVSSIQQLENTVKFYFLKIFYAKNDLLTFETCKFMIHPSMSHDKKFDKFAKYDVYARKRL